MKDLRKSSRIKDAQIDAAPAPRPAYNEKFAAGVRRRRWWLGKGEPKVVHVIQREGWKGDRFEIVCECGWGGRYKARAVALGMFASHRQAREG